LRIALAQINSTVGDFEGNADKIIKYTKKAALFKADLVVFPEMSLCGYPPMDLLDYESFVCKNLKHLKRVIQSIPSETGVVVGYIDKTSKGYGKKYFNMAALIFNGRIVLKQAKTLLPSYDVFDESRYFEPAEKREVVSFKKEKIGIAICEDIWWETESFHLKRYPLDPVKEIAKAGATLLLAPSASPYYPDKPVERLRLLKKIGKDYKLPVVYVNMVGGNDSLIFDGQSMATSPGGKLIGLAKGFEEDLCLIDTTESGEEIPLIIDKYEQIERAIILGLKDYLAKCRFTRVHLGLSGGIDSAVTAVLAVKALGPGNVKAFSMPSRYSSKGSITDSRELAQKLNIKLETINIEPLFKVFLESLEPIFKKREPDITEENLQARIRGMLLMAYSNKFHSLLLATGNKSELSTGYCTLYGDMCGGISIIGDLLKTEVYELARFINTKENLIPESIITKKPSAELKANQTDQDSLPPYKLLDDILSFYLLKSRTKDEIVKEGFDRKEVEKVLKMVAKAEYKRRQAALVLKLSPRAFGTGRRMPIARRFHEI
jgi:NAD+ synthase (glutamine-hydrolysing)